MTVSFVSVDEFKEATNRDSPDQDLDIQRCLDMASRWVVRYLKGGASQFVNDAGEAVQSADDMPLVKGAVIYIAAVMLRNPDNDTEGAFNPGYPPGPVVSMLYSLRDPALA